MISLTPYDPGKEIEQLKDKAVEVYKRSARLEASVRPGLKSALIFLLRFVNSYYSNKIEGNKTRPADVIRAHHEPVESQDPAVRDELREVLAHVEAQYQLSMNNPGPETVCSRESICHIHELFFRDLPESSRTLVKESSGERFMVIPGMLRDQRVEVGRHLAPEPSELNGLLNWFADAYRLDRIHGDMRLLAAAASHHRLLWIHPFLDGNGRVTRLYTDLYLQLAGVDGYGLWSISRGFSRHIDRYKAALALADMPRQGATDGRGWLSSRGLVAFQTFFLDTCLEQIDYLDGLLDMERFDRRLAQYVGMRVGGGAVDEMGRPMKQWRPEAGDLLKAVIDRSGVMRSDVPAITGLGETLSRQLVSQLCEEGWLEGEAKKPLTLSVPFDGISFLFPHLW